MLNPYKLISEDSGYSFETDSKQDYYIYFFQNDFYFQKTPEMNGLVYDFVFGKKVGDSESKHDYRISETIVSTVIAFLTIDPNNVICYFCDDSDGLSTYRNRLFRNWYNKYLSEHFEILAFNSESVGMQGAVLINSNSHIKSFVKEAFFKEFT